MKNRREYIVVLPNFFDQGSFCCCWCFFLLNIPVNICQENVLRNAELCSAITTLVAPKLWFLLAFSQAQAGKCWMEKLIHKGSLAHKEFMITDVNLWSLQHSPATLCPSPQELSPPVFWPHAFSSFPDKRKAIRYGLLTSLRQAPKPPLAFWLPS